MTDMTNHAPSDIAAHISHSNEADDGTIVAYTILAQVKSNRIVYFTDDPEYTPSMEGDWYYVSSYLGRLPTGMTLRNCWRWRFNGGVFTDAGQKKTEENPGQALIDHNRVALQSILLEKIDLVRAPYAPTSLMGGVARSKKLADAQTYLSDPAQSGIYPMLEVTAVARNCTLREAAQLIVDKAAQTDKVLQETEAIRENFTRAIRQADTEEAPLQIRDALLSEVFPALTQHFAFKTEHTEPPKPDQPLSATQLRHEQMRLQVQLREKINKIRSGHVSQYLLDDTMLRHKGKIAEILIAHGGAAPANLDYAVLGTYAQSRGISLIDASREVLAELGDTAKVLIKTEQTKDVMLKHIASIKTLRDLHHVAADIETL